MTNQYYKPMSTKTNRLYGFYILMLIHFMLVHYNIWQRADPERSPIPFSDFHFIRDFSTHPLQVLDLWTCILIGSSLLLVLVSHLIKTYRALVISEHSIYWFLFEHPYRKVCKLSEVQQLEYIAIPPNDQHQMVLLRLHTAAQNYDLNLSQFNMLDQKLIYEQLAQRFPESEFPS